MSAPKTFRKGQRAYAEGRSFVAEGLVPLPRGKKSPPLAGRTGYSGETTALTGLADADDYPRGNVGFRVPAWLVGLDVDGADHGEGKNGPDTIAELERTLGPLPATLSSSRHGAESPTRIHFFEIPEGVRLSERRLSSIELIQHHHRFAVVWPSRLRDGSRYRWYDAERLRLRAPLRAHVTELPGAWLRYLTDESHRSGAAQHVAGDEVAAWLDALPGGTLSPLLRAEMTAWRRDVGNSTLLHHVGIAARSCVGRHGGKAGFELFIETIREQYLEKYSGRKFEVDLERALGRVIADMRAGEVTVL